LDEVEPGRKRGKEASKNEGKGSLSPSWERARVRGNGIDLG
jgi:hypothetical protein